MKEKEKILKELRKRQFKRFLQDKEFITDIISKALSIEKKHLEKNLVLYEENKEYGPYDLIVKITDTRIKITTSKYNKIIKNIKKEDKLYKMWYDEKYGEYKIKIYLDEILEYGYKIAQEEDEQHIKELLGKEKISKEDMINLQIARLSMQYCDNVKISISGII